MLRSLVSTALVIVFVMAVNAEQVWLGVNQYEAGEIEVMTHNSSYTDIEIDIKGAFIEHLSTGEMLYSVDGIVMSEIPNLTRMIAIPPYKDIEIEILSAEFTTVEFQKEIPLLEEIFQFGRPVLIRDLRAVSLTVFPFRKGKNAGEYEMLRRANIRLNYKGYSPVNNKDFNGSTSQAFSSLYNSAIINYDWLDSNNPYPGKGTYLIITPEAYTNASGYVPSYDEFVSWKKAKGYQVEIHIVPQSGTTTSELYAVIQDYYDNAEPPLEYVLLVGDSNGGNTTIPTFTNIEPPGGGQNDPSDHPYTLLEGDDYFSDILIGRLSVSNYNEALVVYNKIVMYEKTPYIGNGEWYKSILACGGNYNDSGPPPITPCQTSWWIADYFLDHGFTTADTILYWGPWDLTPGNYQQINASINAGKSHVAYRGWADANGWQKPLYNVTHLVGLQNGWMLPVFGSFVCNTGNFNNDEVNPCFGEKLVRMGSYYNGNGAIAFYGPSDLYTNSNYNNALSSGFYEGFWEGGTHSFGAAAAYSKMTLYEGFPNKQEWGGYAWFYFHVYNCLGDPELEMWNDTPQAMTLQTPASLLGGASSLEATVTGNGSGLQNAYVTVLHDDELIAGGYSESDGGITLTFDPVEGNDITVTATLYGYQPAFVDISLNSGAYVGYLSDSLANESEPDGCLNPGESADLYITVKNFGSDGQNNVSGTLSTTNPYISISGNPVSFGNIAAGAAAGGYFSLTVDDNAPNFAGTEFTLDLTSSSGNYESKFAMTISGSVLEVDEVVLPEGPIFHGMQKAIDVVLINNGDFPASGVNAVLTSLDPEVTVIQGQAQYGNIAPGQSASNSGSPMEVQVASGAFEGKMAQMKLSVTPGVGGMVELPFYFVIGTPDPSDPTGPDAYGYYAYDDGDIYYTNQVPTYEWVELDPTSPNYIPGATQLFMGDDSSTLVDLPFDFVFYGETYDQITICTNGWVSFTETWMSNFRNWDMPSPLGPHTLVCAFWDDLKDTTDGILDMFYWHDPAGRFIVEWSKVHNRFQGPVPRLETFELILYDPTVQSGPTGDGDILIQFHTVNDVDYDNNFSTVGIEDYWHDIGLEYIFSRDYNNHPTAAELHDEMAILITTTPPMNYSGVEDKPQFIPDHFALQQNFPNPFNSSTRINFSLAQTGMTELKVFDISGRLIQTLLSGELNPGVYSEIWNGTDFSGKQVASGIYFFQLNSGEYKSTMKGILLK